MAPVRRETVAIPSNETAPPAKSPLPFKVPTYGELHYVEDADMDAKLGEAGCWTTTAALPIAGWFASPTEEPHSTRHMRVVPAAIPASAADVVMQHMGAASMCVKGQKGLGDNKLNQDNFCLSRLFNGWTLVGVFDGHGPRGEWASSHAALSVPYFLQQKSNLTLLEDGKVEKALQQAFKSTQQYLVAASEIQGVSLQLSGTTAVLAVYHATHDRIWVANLGDSRAVLMLPDGTILHETTDQTPDLPDETRRIEDAGGKVQTDEIQGAHGTQYIHRVAASGKTDGPAVGVARAFGDQLFKKKGVIAEPVISEWPLERGNGAFLLLCSDGVWEYIQTGEATKTIAEVLHSSDSKASSREALEALYAASRTEWMKEEVDGEPYIDDITMVMLPVAAEMPRSEQFAAHEPMESRWRPFFSCTCTNRKVFQN